MNAQSKLDSSTYKGASRLLRSIVSVAAGAAVLASMSTVAAQAGGLVPSSPLLHLGGLARKPASIRSSWISTEGRKAGPLVYVADGFYNAVVIYRLRGHNQKPVGQLAVSNIQALTVDSDGNLWVVADAYPNSLIYKYRRGAMKPSLTLNDPGSTQDIAVVNGTVYAANWTTAAGNGNVVVYANGAQNPTETLTNPSVVNAWGLTVDGSGNIYLAAGNAQNSDFLGEFAAGSNAFSVLTPTTYNYLICTPQLDNAGNVVVRNDFASYQAQNIEVFSPPSWGITSQFGGPTGSCGLGFTVDFKDVFMTSLNGHLMVEYSYPGGQQVNEINDGLYWPFSVAVSQ
jgi:hypothetical protein